MVQLDPRNGSRVQKKAARFAAAEDDDFLDEETKQKALVRTHL